MPEFAQRLAAERPDEAALVDGERTFGWAEIDRALNQTADNILGADLGPANRIAVFAENAAETALAHLGGLLGGASTVPVNLHLTADEAAYILDDSDTSIVFVGPETAERGLAAARAAGVGTVVGWGDGLPDEIVPWTTWLAGGADVDPPGDVTPRPNLLYTSGTTGRPKGTELPPTMFAGGDTMDDHLEGLKKARFAAYGPHLVVGPMYHTGPLSGMRILVAGTSSVILGRFDAEATLAAIDRHKTRSAVMVPTHFVRLLALPDEVRARYDVSSMELVTHTGAKCPEEVKRAMIEWWGPCFVEAYGASEVGTTCSCHPSRHWWSTTTTSRSGPMSRVVSTSRTPPAAASCITTILRNRRPPISNLGSSRSARSAMSTTRGSSSSPTASPTWWSPAASTSIPPRPRTS